MKIKLLRKLRADYRMYYIPESAKYNERWEVKSPKGTQLFFTYQEALDKFLSHTHTEICNYIDIFRSKRVMP